MGEIIHDILHELLHAVKDTLILVPFLYLAYLLMEFIEHRGGERAEKLISSSGKLGPLAGGLLGIIPQCGLSAAASGLYAGRMISLGTLMALFLSTSDEMLPIMISEQVPLSKILPILLCKAAVGIVVGFATDAVLAILKKRRGTENSAASSIHELCEDGHCHCEKGIFWSALIHTLEITLFIFIATAAMSILIYAIGEDTISAVFSSVPVLGEAIAALIGLIPNCASSVIITELYLDGIISAGPMMAGLLSGSGVGLLVLFKVNKDKKQAFSVLGLLYAVSVAAGVIIGLII